MPQGQITYLDGYRLHRGLTAGFRQVLAKQNYLNKINVFPVPDGDTGTNLCFTLISIMDGTNGRVYPHAGRMAVAIADAALDGARGNSGVIMAQFFQGFSDPIADEKRLSVAQFAEALQSGYDFALQSLSNPAEGTILTVIRAAAESLVDETGAGLSDFHQALEHALEGADVALKNTPEQLAVLKESGVVDAGAQGFVYLLRGIYDFIASGSIRAEDEADQFPTLQADPQVPMEVVPDSKFRYCTECLIVGENLPMKELREAVINLGDSMVLGGSKSRAKLHIHTNEPKMIFETVGAFGTIEGQKVDDMLKQVEVSRTKSKLVAIVTDSTADMPPEMIEAYDIHVVPARLSFGNTGYLDKVTITSNEFYTLLAEGKHHPQTSQPTPGDFWRIYQFLASHYDSIISIHLPRPVSGTLQSAENAARRIPGANIDVLDGLNTAVGLGLIVTRVAEAAKAGKKHKELVQLADSAIGQTRIYAAVKDLSYAVRGGRISASKKRLVDLVRATPIISIDEDSKVSVAGRFFGRNDLADGFAKWVGKRMDNSVTYKLFISHARCLDEAERFVARLPDAGIQASSIDITETGTALGVHTGPGSLIIGLQPAELS